MKTRVTVTSVDGQHRIFIECNGKRTPYAVTDQLPKAKRLVIKAKRKLGIVRHTSGGLSRVKTRK